LLRAGRRSEPLRSGDDVALPRARLRSAADARPRPRRAHARWAPDHRGAAAGQRHLPALSPSLAGSPGASAHGPLQPGDPAPDGPGGGAPGGGLSPLRRVPGLLLSVPRTGVHPPAPAGPRSVQGHLPVFRGPGPARAPPLLRATAEPGHADGRLPEGGMKPSGPPAPAESIEAQAWAALLRRPGSARAVVLMLATLLLMTVAALVMLVVATATLYRARRLYRELLARGLARAILAVWRIRVVVHADRPWPASQTMYISNHTSTIDLFVLVALGLPRTRFFLSGFLRKIVPLGIISTLMGTFHTPPQTDRAARVRCFQEADRTLRRTGDSVYLSPEGQRVTTGAIGVFNRGAFHLATSLRVPI